jgi:hypothetical protein
MGDTIRSSTVTNSMRREQLSITIVLAPRCQTAMPLSADNGPRLLWSVERDDHVVEAQVISHRAYTGIVIRVDGRPRDAKTFMHASDALRWAEQQRAIMLR